MKWEPLPFDKPGPDGYYRRLGSLIYVHLLGTNHPHEWHGHKLRNTGRLKTTIGRVHKDYYYAALRIVEWLRCQKYTDLSISGHSYGGAVAEIVAAIQDQEGIAVVLRTYGGVKPGVLSHRLYNAIHYRHRGDPVPWWPLWPWYRRNTMVRTGPWRLPWIAHKIQNYRNATGHDIP